MTSGSVIPPMHYADWFRRHALTRGGNVAIATPQGSITYEGFHRALHAVAYRLSESKVENGQTIALCAQNLLLQCVLIAALNRLGCVPVTLSRPLKAGVPVQLPDGLPIDRILVERPFAGLAPEGATDVHFDWLKTGKQDIVEWQGPGLRDDGATAHIFTSSGTTGVIKSIGCSTKQLQARILKRSIGILSTGRTANSACQFGLRSTIGFQTVFSTLWSGGTIFVGFPDNAVPALVQRRRIERIEASPAQYSGILRETDPSQFDLSSLRFAIVSGSATPQPLITAIRTKLCNALIGHYGATELGMISFGPLRATGPAGSCGHLVPWMQAEVVDQDDELLPAGTEGALRFRCEEMATCYLNDAAATSAHFKGGWFYPGDLGTISEQRALTISGRSSERINAGGVKVSPEIIEKVIVAYPGIVECAAFGMPDAMGLDRIFAAFVADGQLDSAKLHQHCAARLGARAPQKYMKLSELPRNEMGKILRSALRERAVEFETKPPRVGQKGLVASDS